MKLLRRYKLVRSRSLLVLAIAAIAALLALAYYFVFNSSPTEGPHAESVTVVDLDATTVRVDVRFNELVRGYIEYGKTREYGLASRLSSEFSKTQSFLIENLQTETVYYYRLVFMDSYGRANVITGNVFTAHSKEPPAPQPSLTLSLIETATVGTSSARITWKTDRSADGMLEYGTSESLGATEMETTVSTPVSHEVLLYGLEPATTYYYRPVSTTPSGVTAYGDVREFTTLPASPEPRFPSISNMETSSESDSSVIISWDTSDSVVAGVEYGPTTSYGEYVESTSADGMSHTCVLSGLSSGTTYYFRVVLVDSEGNVVYSNNQTFSIGGAVTPQTPVQRGGGGLPVISSDPILVKVTPLDGSVSFEWLKDRSPLNGEIHTLVIRKRGLSPVFSRIDGEEVYDGPSTSFMDIGLTNGTEYHYALYSYDQYGRYTSAARFRVVPEEARTQVNISAAALKGPTPPALSRDLSVGMEGDDVKALQAYLATQGYYPEAIVDGYFGLATRDAVVRYQRLHEISPAEGFVGALTRESLAI